MSEETTTPGATPPPVENPPESASQPGSSDLIRKADAAADRLEKANERMEVNIQRQENLAVEKTLGGRSDVNVEQPKEETPAEYSKRVLAGDVDDKK